MGVPSFTSRESDAEAEKKHGQGAGARADVAMLTGPMRPWLQWSIPYRQKEIWKEASPVRRATAPKLSYLGGRRPHPATMLRVEIQTL